MTATASTDLAVLTFRVGGATMSVSSDRVAEVLRRPLVTRVPHAPACVLGVSSLRGRVVPVVSAARLLDRPERAETSASRTLLLDLDQPLALAVDAVIGLNHLTAAPSSGGLFVEDGDAVRAVDLDGALEAAFGRTVARIGGARAATSARPEAEAVAEETRLVLTFGIGAQTHALALDAVEEVTDLPAGLAALPHGERADLGVAPYRKGVLPVVDLAALLGLEPSGAGGRLLVVRLGDALVGLRIDRFGAILRVPESAVAPTPALLNRGGGEAAVESVARLTDGTVVSLLAPDRLFRAEALEAIMADGRQALDAKAAAAQDGGSESFVIFALGGETYGLPIADVQEVVAVPESLVRVPKAPVFIEGVMNLRGRVVPVIDQGRRFGAAPAAGLSRKVIVARAGPLIAGFVVDAVSAIRSFSRAELGEPSELLQDDRRLFDRVAQTAAGEVILLVDPAALLEQAEADVLATLTAEAESAS